VTSVATTDVLGKAAAPTGRRRPGRLARRRRQAVFFFMLPWIIGFTAFFVMPLIVNTFLSFHRYNLINPPEFIGLKNYRFMLNDDKLIGTAIKNSLWMMAVAIPANVLWAFFSALTLSRARRRLGFFRTVFYLPALAPLVAATLGFVYLLNPGHGPVNIIIEKLGFTGPLWFEDKHWSKPSLVLLAMWGTGNLIIIFLAALLDVPVTLYESAALDGANALQRLRYITLPTISPVLLFAVVIGVVQGAQYFTEPYVASTVTGGGAGSLEANSLGYPEQSTLFYVILLYQQGFRWGNMGYAAAMAQVLFIAAFTVILLILRISRRWVHHQGGGS
jgi:multiple sugar transport system permease protein